MRSLIALLLLCTTTWAQTPVRNAPPDKPGHMGWSGPESLRHTAEWAAQQPRFELVHPSTREPVWQDNANVRVCLWEDVVAVNGRLTHNYAQEIGDCTSQGAKKAIERTQARQLKTGPPGRFKEIDSAALYGAGRVWVAKGAFGPGDGCSGASIARAARDFGVLPSDTPGLPPYSGERAREWGRKGPPEQFRAIMAQHRVKTVAQLFTPEDVRDAVCNGYGVSVASMWGTTNASMREQDGRIVARRTTRWAHQMCIDGYDGTARRKYWHVTNSWGEDAHPEPIDGSPPGGFWIEEDDLRFMLSMKDTWAFSDFEGFPAELDLSPLRPKRRQDPPPQPAIDPLPLPRREIPRPLKGSVS